eukprot:COSAG02_NODE_3195_length_7193_cov_1.529462_7_plen_46_part_00
MVGSGATALLENQAPQLQTQRFLHVLTARPAGASGTTTPASQSST